MNQDNGFVSQHLPEQNHPHQPDHHVPVHHGDAFGSNVPMPSKLAEQQMGDLAVSGYAGKHNVSPTPAANWHESLAPTQMHTTASAEINTPMSPNFSTSGLEVNAMDPVRPVPVVRVLSPYGVEYVFMTFALWVGAVGLASVLIAMVNGKFDFAVLSFPAATLLVTVPLFAFLFLRLKRLELARPELRLDQSKRRSTQLTQVVTFGVCMFTLIGLVFTIFAKMGGQVSFSITKAILDAVCVLVVAGGILAYYWRNEHRS